ncbi:MAG: hemolysin III family protein [Clostridia bacterium]|nr:hemolysin III family protein [Clostridia bacterium]
MTRQKLSERTLPKYTKGEEIFNMVSHIVGGGLGVVALTLCVIFAAINKNVYGVVGSAIYGASLIILYTMSSIYHGLSPRLMSKKVFQVLDHCSIFFLIAGTYTPISLSPLRQYNPLLGWTIFSVVWATAIVGIVLNSIDIKKYKKLSAICYLLMGWCIIFAWKPTVAALDRNAIVLLLAGGVSYTVGAMIYYFFKKKPYSHSIFHLFVVMGSIFHFFTILLYCL